jgi:8-oxo-dGTP pyrophosphatase MutT (NUDIX family)
MDNIENEDSLKKKCKKNFCSNCGYSGHLYKNCTHPITSYGIIDIRIDNTPNEYITDKIKDEIILSDIQGINYTCETDLELFGEYKDKIKFLLIRRKHTLGYIEFIRGHYKIDNIDGIIYLFRQMIDKEIDMIKTLSFNDLWFGLWGPNNTRENEYKTSYEKFSSLQEGGEEFLTLDFYINNIRPQWEVPEWGFPKGRRNFQETDLQCANREFQEESGISKDDYNIIEKIYPVEEVFIGTNGIQYKHVYYTSLSNSEDDISIDPENNIQIEEIGDIGWFTYYEAVELIRPYHTKRIKILSNIYMYMMNILIKQIKL